MSDVPPGAPDHRARRARYLAFDGIQDPLTWRVDVRDALERMSEEVLHGFGVRTAMRRLLEQGMDGVRGLDELRRRLAEQRRRTSTGPAQRLLQQLGEELTEIIDLERGARIE